MPGVAWFAYRRAPGKLSAVPINARGWLALIGAVVATIAVAAAAQSLLHRHPVMAGLSSAAVTVTGVLLILRLVVAKGRLSE